MDKLFVYDVNGTKFEDTTAWGEAWQKAEALAKEEHTAIFRQVVSDKAIRNEVFFKGCFLRDNEENRAKATIF